MIEHYTASPDNLARTLAVAPDYYRPILYAMREGVALAVALPGSEVYAIPFDQPTIVIMCDDAPGNESRRGPARFEGHTLRRVIRTCRAGLITSCEPIVGAYALAATTAVLQRRHVLIIETRPEHEADWHDLVRAANPSIRLVIATVKPEGRA